MIRIFTFVFILASLFYFGYGDKFISINCQNKKYAYYKNENWFDIENLNHCPSRNKITELCNNVYNDKFTSTEQINQRNDLCKNDNCKTVVYNCVKFEAYLKPTSKESKKCVIKHQKVSYGICKSNIEWIKLASVNCHEISFELHHISGVSCNNSNQQFMAVEFICCPQLDVYQSYFNNKPPTSIAQENWLYSQAKRMLRSEFRMRQKQIDDKFIKNEKDLTIWDQYPKLASKIEKSIQDNFRKSFVTEIETEVKQLKKLEFEHENRLQRIYEERRKIADDRNRYVLQEMSNSLEEKLSRVTKALRIELKKILEEADEKRAFLNRLIVEGLVADKSDPFLINKITNDFNSIINDDWQLAIKNLDSQPDIKHRVINSVKDLSDKRDNLYKEFQILLNNKDDASLPGYQAETSVQNYINEYGHNDRRMLRPSQTVSSTNFNTKPHISLRSKVELISIVCLSILMMIVIIGAVLIMYRNSRKINSVLTNTVKKWRPISGNCGGGGRSCKLYNRHILHVPTGPLNGSFDHYDQYPFSTHSYILNPNDQLKQIQEQTLTSSDLIGQYNLSNNKIENSFLNEEHNKQEPIIIDFTLRKTNENSEPAFSDIDECNNYSNGNFSDANNGLDNSICRLLDEK